MSYHRVLLKDYWGKFPRPELSDSISGWMSEQSDPNQSNNILIRATTNECCSLLKCPSANLGSSRETQAAPGDQALNSLDQMLTLTPDTYVTSNLTQINVYEH